VARAGAAGPQQLWRHVLSQAWFLENLLVYNKNPGMVPAGPPALSRRPPVLLESQSSGRARLHNSLQESFWETGVPAVRGHHP